MTAYGIRVKANGQLVPLYCSPGQPKASSWVVSKEYRDAHLRGLRVALPGIEFVPVAMGALASSRRQAA